MGLRDGAENAGALDGCEVDGLRVGSRVGELEGRADGDDDTGRMVGVAVTGFAVGCDEGAADVGRRVGWEVGEPVGAADVGRLDGDVVVDGALVVGDLVVGLCVGEALGRIVGAWLGVNVSVCRHKMKPA